MLLRLFLLLSIARMDGIYTKIIERWLCWKQQRMLLNSFAVLFKREADKCFDVYVVINSLCFTVCYCTLSKAEKL